MGSMNLRSNRRVESDAKTAPRASFCTPQPEV